MEITVGGLTASIGESATCFRAVSKKEAYLGSDQFVDDTPLGKLDPDTTLGDVPRVQVLGAQKPLEYFRAIHPDKDHAMGIVYLSGHYTLEERGACFGKEGRSTMSRKVRAYESLGKQETWHYHASLTALPGHTHPCAIQATADTQ